MATHLCPCGYLGEPNGRCHCTMDKIERYRGRLSGPLLDRIDLQVELLSVPVELLFDAQHQAESSQDVRQRVTTTRQRQLDRSGTFNSQLSPRQLDDESNISRSARSHLADAMTRLGLSARSFHRMLRVARTIADMAGCDEVLHQHIAEAIRYRSLDRYLKNAT